MNKCIYAPGTSGDSLHLLVTALLIAITAFLCLADVEIVFAAGAANSNTVLIYGPGTAKTVWNDQAVALGFTVESATDAAWNAKTTNDFKTYKAIIIPDSLCAGPTATVLSTRTTWGPAVTGNILVVGGDPDYHAPSVAGATSLIYNGISFAANDPGKTGAFLPLGCYQAVSLLDQFGTFAGTSSSVNAVHLVAVHPALTGLTDANQSNWGQSTHTGFTQYPADFTVLAIQDGTNIGTGYACYADGHCGQPYLLARGTGVQAVGLNIIKTAASSVTAGSNITYTLTYGNSGGTNATGVIIKDPVPTGTTFVSATGGGTLSSGEVVWNIGSVNAGVTGQTVTMTVNAPTAGTVINTNYTIQSDQTSATVGANVGTTVTAPPTYTVSASSGANGSLSCTPTTVNNGSMSSCAASASVGYHVSSLSGCGISYSNSSTAVTSHTASTTAYNSNCTVTAAFAINTFDITATPDSHSKIDSYGLNTAHTYSGINYNASQSLTVTADTGYHLTGITNSCGGTASAVYSNTVNGPWTSSATFVPSGTAGQVSAGVVPNCSISATSAINVYSITPTAATTGP